MNNKKTLFMSLMIVLLVGLMISAGTFAYFQWTTDVNQRTNVNVTIEAGGIKMIMTPVGGRLEATGLKPVADCMESYAYFDTIIQIQNTTGSLVVPSFKLKARVKPNDAANAGALKKADLERIHYTVVEIDGISQTIKADKTNDTGARRCYEPSHIQKSGVGRAGLFADTANDGTVATGTFASMSEVLDEDGWTSAINLPSDSSKFLARQYNDDPVKGDLGTFGITFVGNIADNSGLTNTTRYFRVYVWIDSGYKYTNVGETISDPLQNSIIEVNWSEDSIVQQVTGSISREPGLYEADGDFIPWAELSANPNDMKLNGTEIVDFPDQNDDYYAHLYSGALVIPEGITKIGASAFVGAHISSVYIPSSVIEIGDGAFSSDFLTEVTFAPNSQLTTIGNSAFDGANLLRIKIPASVTSIQENALEDVPVIIYEGTVTQWGNILLDTYWYGGVRIIDEVICSDGTVTVLDPWD